MGGGVCLAGWVWGVLGIAGLKKLIRRRGMCLVGREAVPLGGVKLYG